MRAFIVRPFGTKQDIDFDAVERDLIAPVLDELGIAGRTTGEIVSQGNIREDMFRLLLTADLVIADLSVHNANVFYELGIRHALREKWTFLLRAPVDDVPFDLLTDRYLRYDPANLAGTKAALASAIRASLDASDRDSPVFRLLPGMRPQDPSTFLDVPQEFREAVVRAEAINLPGDLALLAYEARGFEWELPALRLVGNAQVDRRDFDGGRLTWEAVRAHYSDDVQANLQLGTVYQRLGNLTESDLALARVTAGTARRKTDRSEAFALQARNAKTRWVQAWRAVPAERWRAIALSSPFLKEAYRRYESAFSQDLNYFYPGVNALGLLTVMVELAGALPETWETVCDDDADSKTQLEQCRRRLASLTGAVDLSLRAARERAEQDGTENPWLDFGAADLAALTSMRPARVATEYRKALAGAQEFLASSVRTQLQLLLDLGVRTENATAALAEFPAERPPQTAGRVLVFTGHRIDEEGRTRLRFPKEMEAVARAAIRTAVQAEMAGAGGVVLGLAGGASGGDILFHEVCAELGVPTQLYLAVPAEIFIPRSVASAGPAWVERFNALAAKLSTRTMQQSEELPGWLTAKPRYALWPRNNLWLLYNALDYGARRVTVIALWDRGQGDGPGGTQDLVDQAGKRGAKTVILNTRQLFGLA
jgi:hypothetical protein